MTPWDVEMKGRLWKMNEDGDILNEEVFGNPPSQPEERYPRGTLLGSLAELVLLSIRMRRAKLNTRVELSYTRVELSYARVELSFMRVELSYTRVELSSTRSDV